MVDLSDLVGSGIINGISDTKIAPLQNVSREQAIAIAWRLYMILGGEDVLLYEETSSKILTELGIVSEEDWNNGTYITTLEALETLNRAIGYHYKTNLSDWYRGDTLSEVDYLNDDTKSLILGLCNYVLTYNEIAALDLESEITNYEALLYAVRLVGDTYGCTDSTTGINGDTESIYEYAYKKGLISDIDTSDANKPIEREKFYNILHKSLFVEYKRGGADGVQAYRLIDRFAGHNDATELVTQTKSETETVKLPVSAEISDDLSIKWTLMEEYSFLIDEKYWTEISLIGKDGTAVLKSSTTMTLSGCEGSELIKYLIRDYDKDCSAIRFRYYKPGESDKEYYFDVNISEIKIVIEGDEINPGTYTRRKGSWTAKEISLGGGDTFEKGCYYILKDYEKTYRKQEYNSVSYEVFKAVSNGNTFKALTNRSFGVTYLDEIHIQKVTIKKASDGGYILSVTPESTGTFTILES